MRTITFNKVTGELNERLPVESWAHKAALKTIIKEYGYLFEHDPSTDMSLEELAYLIKANCTEEYKVNSYFECLTKTGARPDVLPKKSVLAIHIGSFDKDKALSPESVTDALHRAINDMVAQGIPHDGEISSYDALKGYFTELHLIDMVHEDKHGVEHECSYEDVKKNEQNIVLNGRGLSLVVDCSSPLFQENPQNGVKNLIEMLRNLANDIAKYACEPQYQVKDNKGRIICEIISKAYESEQRAPRVRAA